MHPAGLVWQKVVLCFVRTIILLMEQWTKVNSLCNFCTVDLRWQQSSAYIHLLFSILRSHSLHNVDITWSRPILTGTSMVQINYAYCQSWTGITAWHQRLVRTSIQLLGSLILISMKLTVLILNMLNYYCVFNCQEIFTIYVYVLQKIIAHKFHKMTH